MKQDYLWNKTGADAEIEGLENALKAFRHAENSAPILPVKIVEKSPRGWFEFFNLRFAFASLAIISVVISVLLLQVGKNNSPIAGNLPLQEKIKTPIAQTTEISEVYTPVVSAPIGKDKIIRRPNIENKIIKIRRTGAPIRTNRETNARKSKSQTPSETLTAEEKNAYDQLMYALSLTGAKLKIVKDKVQGIDEKIAVADTAK